MAAGGDAVPEFARPGWVLRSPDYLFLSFTNANAFSPTDTLPVRAWVKMITMIPTAVSLLTAVLVVTGAVNLEPGSARRSWAAGGLSQSDDVCHLDRR